MKQPGFPQVPHRFPQVAIGETQDQIDRLTTRAQISEDWRNGGSFGWEDRLR